MVLDVILDVTPVKGEVAGQRRLFILANCWFSFVAVSASTNSDFPARFPKAAKEGSK